MIRGEDGGKLGSPGITLKALYLLALNNYLPSERPASAKGAPHQGSYIYATMAFGFCHGTADTDGVFTVVLYGAQR